MIKPFKFLRGTNGDIVVSTPRGGYYDRTKFIESYDEDPIK